MRIDHHAYQRATRVAAFGFAVQGGVGLTLLILSFTLSDTPLLFSSLYVLLGLFLWLGLIVTFHQHTRERLEALEEDELAAARSGTSSVFDAAADDVRVAARRLRLMHKWLLPIDSLWLAAILAFSGWRMLRYMGRLNDPVAEGGTDFQLTSLLGWAVAICLAFAALSFIVSRFVAGMSKQTVWQNLRGGAGYMVGNALVLLAVAVGIIFRFFGNDSVIETICYAIPVFMCLVALEIVLNFVLNLYRPRVPGETPRAAFDSRVLSLFAAPDNLVRSLNEAVNYQFGFDVTSSWGYQLLLRSFIWLLALGAVVLVVLNMIVIVEPHEQAVKLSGGRIVDDEAHGSGILWKLPYPFQTAEVYDVSRVRSLYLTARRVRNQVGRRAKPLLLWNDELSKFYDEEVKPFIVSATQHELTNDTSDNQGADDGDAPPETVSRLYSLVDSEMAIQYRVKDLLHYLNFGSDAVARRQRLTVREQALKALALREITLQLSQTPLEEILATRRIVLKERLSERIQGVFDDNQTGVQLVALNILMLRPSGHSAAKFEDLALSTQAYLQRLGEAQRDVTTTLTILAGTPERGRKIAEEIDLWDALKAKPDEASQNAARVQRVKIEQLMRESNGQAAQDLALAETAKWAGLMNKRAQASRIEAQRITYRAAPRLYRQREIMRMITRNLQNVRKYVIGIDPARLNIEVELRESNPLLNFEDAIDTTGNAQ